MNDEIIIPAKVEVEQGNIKQTIDQIRSYMNGLEKRRVDLINQRNLVVTQEDIEHVNERLLETENRANKVKNVWAELAQYFSKANDTRGQSYAEASFESLTKSAELTREIAANETKIANLQDIVTQKEEAYRQALEETKKTEMSEEFSDLYHKQAVNQNSIMKATSQLVDVEEKIKNSKKLQEEYTAQMAQLEKERHEQGIATISSEERQLAQKRKSEVATEKSLKAEQTQISKILAALSLENTGLEVTAKNLEKIANAETASRTGNAYDPTNDKEQIHNLEVINANLKQSLSEHQAIFDKVREELNAGAQLKDTYKQVGNTREAELALSGKVTESFKNTVAQAGQLVEEDKLAEKYNREATRELERMEQRYSGLIGKVRQLYDLSLERVNAEKKANEELGGSDKATDRANSAFYKLVRSIKMLSHEVYSMNQNVDKLGAGFIKAGKNLGKMVLALSTGFLSLAASIKKTTQAHKGMNNEFKLGLTTILKYGFGIRSLFVLFNRLRGGIVDALKALALASDYVNQEISSLVTSLKFMEAAAATVVQPILKVLAPALEILSAAFEKAAYYASSFIATLTGQDFVFRAARSQLDFAKSLDKTGKAAKKARKELGYYDKLNVIHKDNKKGSGSGLDDKYAGFDYKKSPLLEDAKKLAQKIQKLVKNFFKPLRKAWRKDGEWVIDKWKGALFSIKDLIASIGSDFMEVWQEDETQKVFSNILKTLGHIGGFFDNLGDSIREAWEENDIGLRILEKLRDMLIDITGSIEKIAEGFEQWALDADFTALFQHFYDLLDSLEKGPLKTICALVEDFFNIVVFPFMTYMVEEGLPKLFDKIKEISDKIDWDKLRERMDKLFGAIEKFDEKLWDAFIIVLGDLGDAVARVVNSEAFGKLIDWVVDWVENTDAETMAKQIEQIAVALVTLKLALKAFSGVLGVVQTIGTFKVAFGNAGSAISTATATAETAAKAPWWNKLIVNIGNVAKSMSALGGEGAGAAAGGGVAGTVAGALAIVAGAFMNLFGVVKQADGEINILTVTLTALGTALGAIGAILLGAPATIAAAIAAVIFLVEEKFVLIWNFVKKIATAPEEFAKSLNETLNDIGKWLDGVSEWFDKIFQDVTDFFYNLGSNVGKELGKIAGKVYRWFKNLPEKISAWAAKFYLETWPKIKTTLKEFPKNLATWISEVDWAQFGKDILNGILWVFLAPARFLVLVGQAIGSFISGFIDSFKEGFDINSPSKVMMPYGEYVLQGVLEGIISAVTGIGSWIKTNIVDKFISGLKDGFKIVNGVAEGLFDIGKNVVEGFKKGVDGNLSKVADAGNNLVNAMKDKVEEKLDINSPSKVFEQIGLYVDEGLAEGIEEGTKKATDAMAKTTDAVADTADSPFALDSIEKFADTFIDTLTSMSTEAISIISTMIDSIDDKMSNLKQVDSLNNTLTRVSKTKIPRIAQGFSIPASIQLQKKSKDEFDWDKLSDIIRDVLEDTVGVVSTNSNKDPVVLMLNGKQIAQAVWDENTKRYKQTGKEGYAY